VRAVWVAHRGTLGGAEQGLAEGVELLVARGHEVHVVLPREGPLRARLTAANGVHIHPHNPWMTPPAPARSRALWLAYNLLKARRDIARLVRDVDADVVITSTITVPAGAFAARLARVPHVWFIHEFGREDHGAEFHLGERISMALVDRLSQEVLANSKAVMRHFGPKLSAGKLRLIPYAVNVPPQPPAPRRASSDRFTLVLSGEMAPSKGQSEAIAALSLLLKAGLDVELVLLGGGDPAYVTQLHGHAAELAVSDRVKFLGFQPDPFPVIAAGDVGLVCSRHEALGRVTIEAMKLGKPVVGSASGGTVDLIRHGWNGLLYEPGSAPDLAEQVEVLYRDRALAREIGGNARKWANEAFNGEAYGAALEAALDSAVQQHRASVRR
jgi:glycosyltransferase involved in cell wall biosynthesis